MQPEDTRQHLERVLFFCQMFCYGFGPAGIWTIGDPVARGYNTFADVHLAFTMFLVDQGEKPIGGFIYPILARIGKPGLLDDVREVLERDVNGRSFGDYLRAYRNRLATHGDLSPDSLPGDVRNVVLAQEPDAGVVELLAELRHAVDVLTTRVSHELSARVP